MVIPFLRGRNAAARKTVTESATIVKRGRLGYVRLEMILPPLKAFRKKHKPPLSQQGLADLLGVDRVTVVRWETGVRKIGGDRLSDVSAKTGIPRGKLRPDLAALMRDAAE